MNKYLFICSKLSQVKTSNDIVIPKDSIRYRIIANSNSMEDQAFKEKINVEIETYSF